MIKKLCEEIFKDDMSDYAIKIAYFTVAPELAKKLSKNEWDEFMGKVLEYIKENMATDLIANFI
jgi:hypothetical protein